MVSVANEWAGKMSQRKAVQASMLGIGLVHEYHDLTASEIVDAVEPYTAYKAVPDGHDLAFNGGENELQDANFWQYLEDSREGHQILTMNYQTTEGKKVRVDVRTEENPESVMLHAHDLKTICENAETFANGKLPVYDAVARTGAYFSNRKTAAGVYWVLLMFLVLCFCGSTQAQTVDVKDFLFTSGVCGYIEQTYNRSSGFPFSVRDDYEVLYDTCFTTAITPLTRWESMCEVYGQAQQLASLVWKLFTLQVFVVFENPYLFWPTAVIVALFALQGLIFIGLWVWKTFEFFSELAQRVRAWFKVKWIIVWYLTCRCQPRFVREWAYEWASDDVTTVDLMDPTPGVGGDETATRAKQVPSETSPLYQGWFVNTVASVSYTVGCFSRVQIAGGDYLLTAGHVYNCLMELKASGDSTFGCVGPRRKVVKNGVTTHETRTLQVPMSSLSVVCRTSTDLILLDLIGKERVFAQLQMKATSAALSGPTAAVTATTQPSNNGVMQCIATARANGVLYYKHQIYTAQGDSGTPLTVNGKVIAVHIKGGSIGSNHLTEANIAASVAPIALLRPSQLEREESQHPEYKKWFKFMREDDEEFDHAAKEIERAFDQDEVDDFYQEEDDHRDDRQPFAMTYQDRVFAGVVDGKQLQLIVKRPSVEPAWKEVFDVVKKSGHIWADEPTDEYDEVNSGNGLRPQKMGAPPGLAMKSTLSSTSSLTTSGTEVSSTTKASDFKQLPPPRTTGPRENPVPSPPSRSGESSVPPSLTVTSPPISGLPAPKEQLSNLLTTSSENGKEPTGTQSLSTPSLVPSTSKNVPASSVGGVNVPVELLTAWSKLTDKQKLGSLKQMSSYASSKEVKSSSQ
nr:MAG: hypothetical protein 1 [Sobelivirales sp.]